MPTVIIIFGITGDLARRKLLPTFFELWKGEKLPKNFRIVGFSRRPFSDGEIRDELLKSLPETSAKLRSRFLSLISYKQGNFDNQESYVKLSEYLSKIDQIFGECSNKLFYLAVPPSIYEMVIKNLYQSGLHIHCGTNERQTKILIEKPFGSDLKTAKSLDKLLGKLFKESQIYRIDHYLGKESLNKNVISRSEARKIKMMEFSIFEKAGVGDRGAFYDKVGALKDVGQNHILQMLGAITAKKAERGELLKKLELVKTEGDMRGQYQGYRQENGVDPASKTETLFRISARIKESSWRDVSFVFQSGKALGENKVEIKITYKDGKNRRKPLVLKIKNGGYDKVILDSIAGSQNIFPTTEEILSQWRFTEKASKYLEQLPLVFYTKGTIKTIASRLFF